MSKFDKPFLLLLLLILVPNALCFSQSGPLLLSSDQFVKTGSRWEITLDPFNDDALFSIPDTSWIVFNGEEQYSTGNWILRTQVIIEDSSVLNKVIGVFLKYFISAYEVYWDGNRVLKRGELGLNSGEQQEGTMYAQAILKPEFLSIGTHSLFLRISNHTDYTNWKWFNGTITIGDYEKELRRDFEFGYMVFLTVGILLIPFFLNLYLYIARGGVTEHLLFCIVCLVTLIDRVVLQIPLYMELPANYVHIMMYTFYTSRVLRSILFPWYFLHLFNLPKPAYIIIGFIVVNVTLAVGFFTHTQIPHWMTVVLLVESAAVTLWAYREKRQGWYIIALGIIVASILVALQFRYMGAGSVLAIFSVFVFGRKYVEKENEEQRAKLRAARIENEMLKKSINSHFLLNSLTSVIVWLRKNPREGIKLVEALAEEYRAISRISGTDLIPFSQELALCKNHLVIMGFRHGVQYTLETRNIDENEKVPPLLFHTIIENGITHGNCSKGTVTFVIERKKKKESTQYIIKHNCGIERERKSDSTGLGMKYIKLRLEESYPNRWSLRSQKYKDGWKTIIELRSV